MTRFARAKGSKSSNEKRPEEATPWSDMKNSMLLKKSNSPKNNTSKEEVRTEEIKKIQWASLGDDFTNSISLIKQRMSKKDKKINNNNSNNLVETKTHKRKRKSDDFEKEENLMNEEPIIKKKNKQQICIDSEKASKKKESKLKKNKKRKLVENENPEAVSRSKKKKLHNYGEDGSNSKKEGKPNKNKYEKINEVKSLSFKNNNFKPKLDKKFNEQQKKRKKFKNKERKSGVEELDINGEKIVIVKFQGFNVTLDDAERLKKLRSEMIKEGIPRAKLEAAIKLERRRAEKALSRLKKSVCFYCRGHGHLLSNCTSLIEKENTGTGICYKCGSTEHSATECKVVKGTQYQFAECFICKEQGHIARQCPDNPRGLYPQGGACRECGDVTHLRKDCPQVQTQKAEEVVTVGLRNDRDLECLDEEIISREIKNSNKKLKKQTTVKF